MSSWYTRAELTRRISWFYSGSALANMFGGVLGAAVLGNLDGDMGLAGWRWLFIIVSRFIYTPFFFLSFLMIRYYDYYFYFGFYFEAMNNQDNLTNFQYRRESSPLA